MSNIIIGCDPEYLVINGNYSTNAGFLVKSLPCGEIGVDHGSSVGELRPKPGTPKQVANNLSIMFHNIAKTLEKLIIANNHYKDYKIVAGGGLNYNQAIGGHIHFGIEINNGKWNLVKALDYFIGRKMKRVPGGKRYGTQYGRPGAIENKYYGFEYRTPPSWLTDPVLTEATLTTAYRIAEMFKENENVFSNLVKKSAKKKDYDMLLGNNKEHNIQIENFRKIIFSKKYQMDSKNCLDFWTNKEKLKEYYAEVMAKKEKILRQKIDLINCDIITSTNCFKVKFGVPKITLNDIHHSSFNYEKVKNGRGRRLFCEDFNKVLYITSDLKKYFKIKKHKEWKVRFVEMRKYKLETHCFENFNNTIFYDSEMISDERIVKMISISARKSIRVLESKEV